MNVIENGSPQGNMARGDTQAKISKLFLSSKYIKISKKNLNRYLLFNDFFNS